jgi:hypothetical protein
MPDSAVTSPSVAVELSVAATLLARSQEAHAYGNHLAGVELAEQAVNSATATDEPTLLPQAYSSLASHRWRLG